jgi:midasin
LFSVATDETILKCCLSFLNCDSFFQSLWPWHELLTAAPNLSNDSKWLAVECLGRVSNSSETKREKIFRNLLSGQKSFDALALDYFLEKNPLSKLETAAIEVSDQNIASRTVAIYGRHLMKDIVSAQDDEMDSIDSSKFVSVTSRESDLIKIVDAIGANMPVMLDGPMGCGKTKLVEHIAKLAGRKEFERFHRVYMSDRTDGRSLVGGYTCHDVPGNFNWEDGVLTR